MKKLITIVLFVFISSFCFAEESIILNLPDYDVTINDETIENEKRQYPILEHKGITYFPMTWFDSRYLGIETIWNSEEGLYVTASNVTGSYSPGTGPISTSSFTARKPNFNVYINNELYTDTEYPCLVYDNVTYLPLTWRVAKENLGWDYHWDNKNGLTINSSNPQINQISLPTYAKDNDIIFYDKHYYFIETANDVNKVQMVHEDNTDEIREIYQYEYSTSYGKNTLANFLLKDAHLWLSFHSGGATMGRDHLYKIKDQQVEETFKGYLDFKAYKEDYVKVFYTVPPGPNNLVMGQNNQSIGNEGIIYGWHITIDELGSRSMTHGQSEKIIGDDLYIFGSDENNGQEKLNRLHKINLETNQSEIIIDKNISYIRYFEDLIYYMDSSDHRIYTCDYNGENIHLFSETAIAEASNWYIYDHQLLITSKTDTELWDIEFRTPSDTLQYQQVKDYDVLKDKLILIFEDDDYGCIIYDTKGEEILRITDSVKKVYNTEDTFFFLTDQNKLLKINY